MTQKDSLANLLNPDGFGEHAYCPPTPLVINQARTPMRAAAEFAQQHGLRQEIDDRGRWVMLPNLKLAAVNGQRVER